MRVREKKHGVGLSQFWSHLGHNARVGVDRLSLDVHEVLGQHRGGLVDSDAGADGVYHNYGDIHLLTH